MNSILNNATTLLGILTVLAFIVNIIVQLTKELVPMPTKLWTIIVSIVVTVICTYIVGGCYEFIEFTPATVLLSIVGAFIVAYVAMYGFDTFKELWEKFKKGGGGIG